MPFLGSTSILAEERKIIIKPAAQENDLQTYFLMGGIFICGSIHENVDFEVSQRAAINTVRAVILGKHDRKFVDATKNNEEVTMSEYFYNYMVPFYVTAEASARCPKKVPDKVNKEVKKQMKMISESLKNEQKKNNKKR